MIRNKSVLAIITARNGSQGLPGKNFRNFLGKPLFMWSVDAALESKFVDFVQINTNCLEIKKIATKKWNLYCTDNKGSMREASHRLTLVNRPNEISTSTSKNEDALLYGVEQFYEKRGFEPDIIVNLQPTSPIRGEILIDQCISAMLDHRKNSLMTASKHTPFFVRIREDYVEWLYNPEKRPMRQELRDPEDFFWHDDGCVYVVTTKFLKASHCRLSDNPCIFENDKYCSMQIDSEDDFVMLEAIRKELDKIGGIQYI